MLHAAGKAPAAVDINPPPWWQENNTIWQVWDFYTSNQGHLAPDGEGNLFGTHLTITPASNWLQEDATYKYQQVYDLGSGVWQLPGGSINAYIENYDTPNPEKRIWIQITWRPQQQGDIPVIYIEDPIGGQTGAVMNPINILRLDSEWIHSTYEIVLNYTLKGSKLPRLKM